MVTLYSTGTEYTANEITLLRATVSDIVSVGVYHNEDPNVLPTVAQFDTVTLVDGTAEPPDNNSEVGKIDVLARIGARVDADLALTAGDYQRWVLVVTGDEDIIRPVDIVEVM